MINEKNENANTFLRLAENAWIEMIIWPFWNCIQR